MRPSNPSHRLMIVAMFLLVSTHAPFPSEADEGNSTKQQPGATPKVGEAKKAADRVQRKSPFKNKYRCKRPGLGKPLGPLEPDLEHKFNSNGTITTTENFYGRKRKRNADGSYTLVEDQTGKNADLTNRK